MARLQMIDPKQADGRVKEIFEGPLKGKEINIFKGMANSPAVLDAYLGMSGALQSASLSAKEQEVIQLVVGEANDCDYCQAAHTALGKKAGLSEEQTVQARRGKIEDDPKLNAIAKFASAMHEKKGFVSDDDLSAFRDAGFDDGAIAEAVATYALASFTNYFNHVNQTPVDFPEPPKA